MLRAAWIALLGATGALGKSYNVHTSVELEAAFTQVGSGDTINLKDAGTYSLTKPLALQNVHSVKLVGRNQRDAVLDGGGTTRILELVDVQDFQIKNIAFNNGRSEASASGTGSGGALLLRDSSDVLVSGCSFRVSSAAEAGGAVAVVNGKGVSITESSFTGNRAASVGGALAATNSDGLSLTKCGFTGNVAQLGGAVVVSGGTGGGLSGNTFTGNQASEDAPAVGLLETSQIAIHDDNSFSGNTVQQEGSGWGQVYLSQGTVSYMLGNSNIHTECGGPESYEAALAAARPKPPAPVGDQRSRGRPPKRGPLSLTVSDIAVIGVPDLDKDAADAAKPDLSDVYVLLKGVGGSTAKTARVADSSIVLWSGLELKLNVDPDAPVIIAEVYDADGPDGRRGTLVGHALFSVDSPSGNTTLPLASGRGSWRSAPRGKDNSLGSVSLRWRIDDAPHGLTLEGGSPAGITPRHDPFAAGAAFGAACGAAGALVAAALVALAVMGARRHDASKPRQPLA